MVTFIVGLLILIVVAAVYGSICERVMRPSGTKTPAIKLRDNVDFVPMNKWKNALIELLNIAGTSLGSTTSSNVAKPLVAAILKFGR